MADGASKKREMERRLLLAKYHLAGRGSAVPLVFDEENDHDPLVLEPCPTCGGRGTSCHERDGIAQLEECEECDGEGTTFRLVRYFSNAAPIVAAAVDDDGWATCPGCQHRFSTHAATSWTGRRHMRCGQRLMLGPSAARERSGEPV